MIEVNFKDRIPRYPGRVKLTPVAGDVNTYTMERADEPTEQGSPLDKATLESITKSRLTGRFYVPTVSNAVGGDSITGVTVSPLPKSGWVYDEGNNKIARNGEYIVTSDSRYGASWGAAQAFTSDGWRSISGYNPWVQIETPQPIRVNHIRLALEFGYSDRFQKLDIQGSNNGATWTTLGTISSVASTSDITYALGAPGDYKYIRLYFTNRSETSVTVRNLSYTNYDILSYVNNFRISEGVPGVFTTEQRICIKTPAVLGLLAVTANTLNGISVNTILQANKRYELRFNGAAFDAKEV